MLHTFDERELLERVDNDWDFLGETVEVLTNDAPRLLADIHHAVAAADAPGVGRAAHAIKGMVANFCAGDAVASAHAVEQIGRSGDLAGAVAAMQELDTKVNALIADLSEFISTRP